MKKLLPILLSALMFTGCAGTSTHQTNTYRQITMDEAVTMMAQETGYIILDVLGVGAYDNGKLVGLAGCSVDCDTMWQIGIDVLPGYRREGIASALTSRLAVEILECGKVPFYCAALCNVKSVRNAIKSGFGSAWVEMTAKSCETVDEMNK